VWSPKQPRQGWRIIVTDDTSVKLYTITQTLRDAGHCVFAAFDGQSALELVATLPFINLLVSNTRLGFVDGPELMRRARELQPGLPILHVVSGRDGKAPLDVPTLKEPFTPEELMTAVRSLVH
jgi:two-component system, OmpR family, response regulator CpxR